MKDTIYIIGEISATDTLESKNKFKNAQLYLESRGFRVFNPMLTLSNSNINRRIAIKDNIRELMNCSAVYILPCMDITKCQNIELFVALELDLFIVQGI